MPKETPLVCPTGRVADFLHASRIARLATVGFDGRPHAVPICFAFDGSHLYSAIDLKPKRSATKQLKRVRNILNNSKVAVVIDHYSENWMDLGYVLIQGDAAIVCDEVEQKLAAALLRKKYSQYSDMLELFPTIIKITFQKCISWGKL